MQQLHLVGFTTDLEGLIFSTRKGAKSGGYLVMLDDRLQATIEDALRLRNGEDETPHDGDGPTAGRPRRPKPESTLSPREIQARLRTGSSITEIAAEAGVDEEWVGRFAAPILAEQAQVVDRARRLTFEKPRLGTSVLSLGEAVRWNLADRDIRFLDDDFDAAWSAYNLQGTSWVVRFQYASRGKRQTAEWEVDLRENELFARNRIASDLAYIDATRRRRRPPVLEPSPRETPATAAGRREQPASPPAPAVQPAPRLPTPAKAAAPVVKATRAAGTKATASSARRGAAAAKATTTKRAASTGKRATSAKVTPTKRAASAKGVAKATGARRAAAAKSATAKAAPAKRAAAAKATKATGGRRAATTKRARATKASGKKPGPDHRGATPAAPAPAPVADIAVRRSHLARPASPMKSANAAPPRSADEGFRVVGRDARVPLPPPRPEAIVPSRPRPAPAAPANGDERQRVAAQGRPDGDGRPPQQAAERPRPAAAQARPEPDRRPRESAPPAGPPPEQRPPAAPPAPAADPPPAPRPAAADERLARRLAARQNGADQPRPARARRVPPAPPAVNEPVWHGPGSGEPAPAVRIRADMAAATVRPSEHPDGAGTPPPPERVRRRRERPLRGR